jgi:outer membrane protein assembly factor BamB
MQQALIWTAVSLATLATGSSLQAQMGAYWPQFRGADRSNIAKDTGLLKEWPKDGPPLLWKVNNLGTGNAPVSVAEGRVYTLAHRDGKEFVVALDRGTGKELWTTLLGPAREEGVMQFLFQRQPVIDGERLYAFSRGAELFCMDVDAGQVRWQKDYRKDFQGRSSNFGWNDNPLVDGDRLLCTPGGKDAGIVALNKLTGEVIWKAVIPDGDAPAHSPIVVAEIGGIRQYVQLLARGLVSIAAKDGKFLWRYNRVSNGTANVAAAIVRGDHIFVTSGYGTGSALLKIIPGEEGFKVDEVYFTKNMLNLNGAIVLLGDHIYGSYTGFSGQLMCLEWKTGNVAWKTKDYCGGIIATEGHLYCRHQNGMIVLVEATPHEYREKSRFMQPDRSQIPAWSFHVLAGGKLYIRDQNVLLCYDVRADRPAAPKAPAAGHAQARLPDANLVPSPHDVVDKMLELANVKKEDVVVDLGCGDGRIPIAAAKKYGCKALGYELDEEGIRLSLANVKKNKVDDLVCIVHEDIFKVDLSQADVVTLYLLPRLNAKLIPQLEKMRPGARIVSHAFAMEGVVPDTVITYTSKEDQMERKLYLWTVPLKREKKE